MSGDAMDDDRERLMAAALLVRSHGRGQLQIFDIQGSIDDEAGDTFVGSLILLQETPEATYHGVIDLTFFRAGKVLANEQGSVSLLQITDGSVSFAIEDRAGGPRSWSFPGSRVGTEISGHHIMKQAPPLGWHEGSWRGVLRP